MLRPSKRILPALCWSGLAVCLIVACGVFLEPPRASAQDVPTDALERALSQQAGQNQDQTQNGGPSAVQTYAPNLPWRDLGPPSPLEKIYSQRAGRVLKQFGYDVVGVPSSISVVQSGALQDDYVLGVGDEIVVTLRGQENATYRQRVSRDGEVVLPKLNTIRAAGRTFGDVRHDIETAASQAFISTTAFVTVGSVHQMSVLVSGEVRSPGVRTVSGLASPLDAILLSGGISKTGSLRNIRVLRAGESHTIDLYSVLANGDASGLGMLRDGDRIYVAPLGRTVAIAGFVRRPGIYELRGNTRGISAQALINLAGGTEIAGTYEISKTQLQRDGTSRVVPVVRNAVVESGEVLFVDSSRNATTVDRVTLIGSVALENERALTGSSTVGDVIRSIEDLKYNAYTQFTVIARRDPLSNAITLFPFSLEAAMAGRVAVPLRSNDIVYVFSSDEIRALATFSTRDLNKPAQPMALNFPSDVILCPTSQVPNTAGRQPLSPLAPQLGGAQSPCYGDAQHTAGTANLGPGPAQTEAGNLTSDTTYASPVDDDQLNPNDPLGAAAAAEQSNPAQTLVPPMNQGEGYPGQDQSRDRIEGQNNSDDLRSPEARGAYAPEADAVSQAQAIAQRNAVAANQAAQARHPTDAMLVVNIAKRLAVPPQALVSTASDDLVWVLDAVRVPGPYLAAPGTTLTDIIEAAGGPSQQADFSGVEITSTAFDQASGNSRTVRSNYDAKEASLATVSISPLDVVRLRSVYSNRDEGSVTVAGQVRYPGAFDITRDERLSSVLQRAGGMTDVAYPFGAIFTRKSAALSEREGNIRAAREVEAQIATLAADPTTSQNASSNAGYLMTLSQELRTEPVLGRITISADPVVLATKPELDVVLQPGDMIFVPKRPSSISVSGEVLNPGSFQYRADYNIQDYIRLAGGTTQSADADRSFVVLPDGSARPLDSSWLDFSQDNRIPPGSTIVVPRDLSPFNWTQFLKDSTQILSQLAISAASIAVLRSNNN